MGRYTVTVEHEDTDLYLTWVHELPGCSSADRERGALMTKP